MMSEQSTEQWVSIQKAVQLTGHPASKISRAADLNLIETRKDPLDRRVRLVNVVEIMEKIPSE